MQITFLGDVPQEALQAARIKAEEDRVKAEQEKAEEWKQRREDDD